MSFDFGGVLGLEVRHNLLDIRQQALKRTMDVLLVLFGGLIISPLLTFLVILVLIDSKGNPFYGQVRIGKGGKKFVALKFRTMVKNAEVVLDDCLEKNPELRKEWEATFKLKNDPRITKVGQFLRKYSLDEFPQLLNVLRGEMSLVGPRPIVDDEVRHYGDTFAPYTRVRPGITGMWQVSGRSDTAYIERVRLDEYYIRNWSIWLDIHILIKTFFVVLRKKGAY
jgi:Undecaprenyl-phosphate galactose phosphotransferase WbaP